MELEVDHIVPESAGGQTLADNLCVACSHCNKFKGNTQTIVDPITQQLIALFNPRTQVWGDHFQ
jgi:5-methylcytosine-specific restriction endonuclease McrA